VIKEAFLAITQLLFWTACFAAVIWSLTNVYVFVMALVLILVLFGFCLS
jgi:hypothetical protein